MLVAIGFSKANQARAAVYDECKALGYELITYVSSKAMSWRTCPIGDNCFVFEANVIQPFVRIGNDVILWSGNHIGHDADDRRPLLHRVARRRLGQRDDRRPLLPGRQRHRSATASRSRRDCVIGAGAVIMKDTEEGAVYSVRGTPAAEHQELGTPNF